MSQLLVAIRIRGRVGVPPDKKYTLDLLRLRRKHIAVLLKNTPEILGMLNKVSDYITWGEISREALIELLKKRGRTVGDKPITEEFLKARGFNSIEELADALLERKIAYKDIPGIKPVFRLTPPSGGFKGTIKKHYKMGGELGYRGEAINELVKKMI
ncbi:MAG: 50S ribosomal protein L30 [Candidatus Verstraetearchaeota archaeon]|nr:50S ribosomal protein L30 [Candidatus Verstraetearchaeota archaeon]